ncbi:hypothetical protein G3I60_10295 [Streptomyces sp. SID13666]|uniref:lipopolysaccharide biosynthesis protein n=1 Tax=unclassified Streptomyces TaxID=2593676 RepID=UPI0013C2678D|nr:MULTISPECIES: hypothetical protein [unclassified Streptomyces]NEA54530.1 hypothetical protein [Streptomyces sp. SID13666]NEA74399.1 hypothetical protein [Streptomyces sp. SID13588]
MKSPTALLRTLPSGTLLVGAGVAANAGASYIFLALAGRTLGHDDMAQISVLWSVIAFAGIGLFFPVEQELTRVVAARTAAGLGAGPAIRRGILTATAMLAVVLAALAAASGPLANLLFNGDRAMVAVLGAAFVGWAAQHTARGILAGYGNFRWYAVQLTADAVLRVGAAITLLAVNGSFLAFGLAMALAPLPAVLLCLPAMRRASRPGPAAGVGEIHNGFGVLVVSTTLMQAVANAPVVTAKLLDPDNTPLVTALVSALILVRVPQFLVSSMQASLLVELTGRHTAGDKAGFLRTLRGNLLMVSALGAGWAVVCAVIGPALNETAFHAPPALSSLDFGLLGLGAVAHLAAIVLSSGTLATGGHRILCVAWTIGALALGTAPLLPGGTALQVELSYAIAAGAAAVALLFGLRSGLRHFDQPFDAKTRALVGDAEALGTVKPG